MLRTCATRPATTEKTTTTTATTTRATVMRRVLAPCSMEWQSSPMGESASPARTRSTTTCASIEESTGGRVGRRATSISSTARTAASSTVTSCAAASSTWRAAVRCRCAGRVKWAPSSSRRRRVTPPRSRATPSRTPRTRLVWPRLLASSSCRFVCASGRARESTRSSVALALRGCALAALLTRACAHRQVPDLLEHQARPRRRT